MQSIRSEFANLLHIYVCIADGEGRCINERMVSVKTVDDEIEKENKIIKNGKTVIKLVFLFVCVCVCVPKI